MLIYSGVYSDNVKDKSLHQTVYGDSRKVFSWRGACSHFCLLEGVRGLKSIAIKGQRLIDAMFKYMKLVTDEANETATMLVDGSSEPTVVTSVSSPAEVVHSNDDDDDHEQTLFEDALLIRHNSNDEAGPAADDKSSMKVRSRNVVGQSDDLCDIGGPQAIKYGHEKEDSDDPNEIEDSDDPCDIDDPQTIGDPDDVDQIEIAALPQAQPKSFTGIEDPTITEKRLRDKQQHAKYVRSIEKMTREQKEALRQYRRVTSRDWRARHAERIKSDEYRLKMREYIDKHRKENTGRRRILDKANWDRKTEEEKQQTRDKKKITNKRYRDKHRKTPAKPEKARTLKEQAKMLAGRAQKAAKKVDAALESGDVKCDALLLVFMGRYFERHEMNIRTGRNPRGFTPPEIFFEIIEA